MRFLAALLLIALLSFIAGLFLPWWSIAIVGFLVALLIPQTIGKSFLSGFLAIFLLWGIVSFIIDIKNESMLSGKIAQLFPLGGSSILLILITALIGALVGGFAAMSGGSLRPAKRKRFT
jgi:predicted membrane metal-binding protein